MELEGVTGTANMPNMSEDSISAVERTDATGRFSSSEEDPSVELLQLLAESGHGSEAGRSLERIQIQCRSRDADLEIRSWWSDTADSSNSFSKDWKMILTDRAKLALLQTIGSCRSLRDVDVESLPQEALKSLLQPLQWNPVLNRISITFNRKKFPTTGVACEILGRILRTSATLKTLKLEVTGLTNADMDDLASALRGNESALEHLNLWNSSTSSHAAILAAEIVHSAPRLRELTLRGVWELDSSGGDTLANALAQTTSLKSLRLEYDPGLEYDERLFYIVGKPRCSSLLLKVFAEGSNNSITSLHLHGYFPGLEESLPRLLSSSHSLTYFHWDPARFSANEGRLFGQSVASSSSTELFVIRFQYLQNTPTSSRTSEIEQTIFDGIEALLTTADVKKPFVEVYVSLRKEWEWEDEKADELLQEKKKPILKLHVHVPRWHVLSGPVTMEHLLKALGACSTVRILKFDSVYCPRDQWKRWVNYLLGNTSISHLGITNCEGLDEDVFKGFMGVLQVNLTLKVVRITGTWWERDGKKALIEEALRRNVKRDIYFSVFRKHSLPFQPARNGRLFLCGSPYAGKTALRHTMTEWFPGTHFLGTKLCRTEGIEVVLLKNDQEMQIAVWDLGGQWIFRTLQDILFPRTNQASIFMFMFSPYDRKNDCIKQDLDQSLKSELEEWLQFIASNSQITGEMLPKVVVVMSHMDKMKDHNVSWAHSIIKGLRKEWENILDICNANKLYRVDARRKSQVLPLRDFIFETFRELLSHKTPLAPKICLQISSILAKRTKDIKYRPIWPSKEFYSFCFDTLQANGNKSSKDSLPFDTSDKEVFQAMTSFLHDTGSIVSIHNSDLDWIIVDPNWLTNVFLGELITTGHNFKVKGSAVQREKLVLLSSKSGFVSDSELQFLFSSFLAKHPKYQEVDRIVLEKLLIHFDLCFKIEDGSINRKYYIPTLVCEDATSMDLNKTQRIDGEIEPLSWSSTPKSAQEFIGFRVQCHDSKKMSMTAALYPRFQIHLRQKLITEMNLTEDDMTCSRNYMYFRIDGHEVFIERSDMAKSHIDVMVKCSEHKTREIAMKDVKQHIINELFTFCASPKGCPGVTLVVGILQTMCVEKLVPLKYRGEKQAILIQRLKENFEQNILKRLEETKPELWNGTNYSSILNYELSWPPIPEYPLLGSSELVRKLLSDSEVESVMKTILERHEQQLRQVDQTSKEINIKIEQELKQVDQSSQEINIKIDLDNSALRSGPKVGTFGRAQNIGDPCSSSPSTCSGIGTSQASMSQEVYTLGHLRREMHERLDRVEVTLHRVEVTLGRIEGNVKQIITLNGALQSLLNSFMQKLDQVVGYAESKEQSTTPKRPYLSSDNIHLYRKVAAKMRLGTPVKLHLMCESMPRPHVVADQAGLDLCLEKENMEWLRCIYQISSKLLYYLTKAGLHVTLGLGQAMPELDSLETTLPVLVSSVVMEDIPIDDGMVSLEKGETMSSKVAWIHLRNSLAPYLKDNYSKLFKLYRVKYRTLEEGGYAWVCDQCMTRGMRNGSLESL